MKMCEQIVKKDSAPIQYNSKSLNCKKESAVERLTLAIENKKVIIFISVKTRLSNENVSLLSNRTQTIGIEKEF